MEKETLNNTRKDLENLNQNSSKNHQKTLPK
jgi:hypothetical protein